MQYRQLSMFGDDVPTSRRRKRKQPCEILSYPTCEFCGHKSPVWTKANGRETSRLDCRQCSKPRLRITDKQLSVIRETTGRELHEHIPLVRHIIKKWFRNALVDVDYEELEQYGMVSLCQFAAKFDPAISKFSTGATNWVRGKLANYIKAQRNKKHFAAESLSESIPSREQDQPDYHLLDLARELLTDAEYAELLRGNVTDDIYASMLSSKSLCEQFAEEQEDIHMLEHRLWPYLRQCPVTARKWRSLKYRQKESVLVKWYSLDDSDRTVDMCLWLVSGVENS